MFGRFITTKTKLSTSLELPSFILAATRMNLSKDQTGDIMKILIQNFGMDHFRSLLFAFSLFILFSQSLFAAPSPSAVKIKAIAEEDIRFSAAPLSDIYPPGRTYSRCYPSEVRVECGVLATDDIAWDPRGYGLFNSSWQEEAFPKQDGTFDLVALANGCRKWIQEGLKELNCSSDFSPSRGCPLTASDLAFNKEHYESSTPWWTGVILARGEKIYITPLRGAKKEKLVLEWTENYRGAGFLDELPGSVDPCNDTLAPPYFEAGSYSTLVSSGRNPSLKGMTLNVDQTLHRYFVTPLTQSDADSYNRYRRCFDDGPNNIPWEAGIPRDITEHVNFVGEPQRDSNCTFAIGTEFSVQPPGTVLYDIARKMILNGKPAIQEGLITELNTSPNKRPTTLNPRNWFVELAPSH